MLITKNNIRDIIETFLKENHYRYSTDFEDSKGLLYQIYLGSLDCFIQVEYDLDKPEDNAVHIQFFTKADSSGNCLYEQNWDNYEAQFVDGKFEMKFSDIPEESIEGHIETLIEETKKYNSVIGKISKKIDQIKEICEEHELDPEEFITVNFDFDN
jgi:hypothetical protein